MKLDNNGNFLWAKSVGGTQSEGSLGMDVDNAGNVISIGRFQGTFDFDPGAGVFNQSSAGNFDIFVLKLDPSGNFIWARKIGGPGYEDATSVQTDDNGNVLFTGSFGNTVDMDPGAGILNFTAAGSDIFVLKLDGSGSLAWAKQMTGTLSSHGSELVVDNSNTIYYTGWFWGNVDFDPGPGASTLTSMAGSRDIFISRLTNDGNLVWVRQIGNSESDEGAAITIDGNANLYLTGYFRNTVDFDPGPGTSNLFVQNGSDDIFVLKLNSSGNFIWAQAMGGTENDRGLSIRGSPTGGLLVTGSFRHSIDIDPGPGTFTLTSAGFDDIFIFKLSELSTGLISAGNLFQLTAFPNPSEGKLYLRSKGAIHKSISMEMLNLLGQNISQFNYKVLSNDHSQEIPLNSLPAGLYYLKILIDGKMYLKSILIE
jgi:hypothetical protein